MDLTEEDDDCEIIESPDSPSPKNPSKSSLSASRIFRAASSKEASFSAHSSIVTPGAGVRSPSFRSASITSSFEKGTTSPDSTLNPSPGSKRRAISSDSDESESPPKRVRENNYPVLSWNQSIASYLPSSSSSNRRSSVTLAESASAGGIFIAEDADDNEVIATNDPNEVIRIDLEDEEGYLFSQEDIYRERSQSSEPEILDSRPTPRKSVIIILDDEEVDEKLPVNRPVKVSTPTSKKRKKPVILVRNPPIENPFAIIPTKLYKGMELRPLTTVELANGDFLMIKDIVEQGETGETTLRGWRLRRQKYMEAILPCKLNEVCWIFDVDVDDERPMLEQSVEEFPLADAVSIRELKITNQQFPAGRFHNRELKNGSYWVADHSVLVVRWKYVTTFATAADRVSEKTRKFIDRRIEFLRQGDCQDGISDDLKLKMFNEFMISGGSGKAVQRRINALKSFVLGDDGENSFSRHRNRRQNRHNRYSVVDDMDALSLISLEDNDDQISSPCPKRVLDLTDSEAFGSGGVLNAATAPEGISSCRGNNVRQAGQKYSYGDIFSGAGGASRGATLAGLDIQYALDCWPVANKTYQKNFPRVKVFQMFSDKFIRNMGSQPSAQFYVDILHISPPCQYWSPAHTNPGKDDERNMASLFSVLGLIKIVRPRMVTIEQTFGLHTPHFRKFFNALVNIFSSLGYSVRWSIVGLANWGLPQSRSRLVMIASGPGELLPGFPSFTHDKEGRNGLKKWKTINDAIRQIPANAKNHDISAAAFTPERYQPPYDPETLAKTITTSGGQNYYPSGRRAFTPREFACLQTFPPNHEFLGPYVKKQIGNAVPPIALGKPLFSHLRRHLEKFDRILQADVVNLDD